MLLDLGLLSLLGGCQALGLLGVTCHDSLLGFLLAGVHVSLCPYFFFFLLSLRVLCQLLHFRVVYDVVGDGWFPFLSLAVAAANRRKRKGCVEFRRAHYEGACEFLVCC